MNKFRSYMTDKPQNATKTKTWVYDPSKFRPYQNRSKKNHDFTMKIFVAKYSRLNSYQSCYETEHGKFMGVSKKII